MLYESELPTTNRVWFDSFHLADPVEEEVYHSVKLPDSLARRRPKRRTPSGSEISEVTASRIFNPGSNAARDFGTLVHAMFEEIEWLEPGTFDEIKVSWKQRLDFPQDMINEALEQVDQCLSQEAVKTELTRPAPNAIVWRERNFEILLNDEWLSGTFDRVVLEENESGHVIHATITDFKTDQVGSARDISEAKRRYQPQLHLYRQVLARMTGLQEDKIDTQLLFTRLGDVINI